MDPYIGQVILFAGNFAPVGWRLCDGSLLAISENQALFSLIGTMYGGDGQVSFGLPDLRGRAPVHVGASPGPGQPTYVIGQQGGSETVALTQSQLPIHSHATAVRASSQAPVVSSPGGMVPASSQIYGPAALADEVIGGVTSAAAGGNAPHNNVQPYLAMNYIIALDGIYPPRN